MKKFIIDNTKTLIFALIIAVLPVPGAPVMMYFWFNLKA